MFCLNLAIGLAVALNFPGTVDVRAANAGMNVTEYEAHFNATETVASWTPGLFTGVYFLGDIFGGLGFLWQNIQYLVDGFPIFLNYLDATFITSSEGHAAFLVIENVLRAVYALLIFTFVVEFISGRIFTE